MQRLQRWHLLPAPTALLPAAVATAMHCCPESVVAVAAYYVAVPFEHPAAFVMGSLAGAENSGGTQTAAGSAAVWSVEIETAAAVVAQLAETGTAAVAVVHSVKVAASVAAAVADPALDRWVAQCTHSASSPCRRFDSGG